MEFLQPMLPSKNFEHANSFVQVESNFRTKTEIEFSVFFFSFFSLVCCPIAFAANSIDIFFDALTGSILVTLPIVFLLSEAAVPRALPSFHFISLLFFQSSSTNPFLANILDNKSSRVIYEPIPSFLLPYLLFGFRHLSRPVCKLITSTTIGFVTTRSYITLLRNWKALAVIIFAEIKTDDCWKCCRIRKRML